MKLKARLFKGIFCFVMGAFLSMGSHPLTLFAGVVPGRYEVFINDDPIQKEAKDTWIFSADGGFRSEGLGIESEWEDTGTNTFRIKTDKKEIIKAVSKNLKLLGLNKSDFRINIKKINISGISHKNDTITGKMRTDFNITIKRPVKIDFSTSGNVDFQGYFLY